MFSLKRIGIKKTYKRITTRYITLKKKKKGKPLLLHPIRIDMGEIRHILTIYIFSIHHLLS